MEEQDKTILFAIVAACILGIMVVSALIFLSSNSTKGFSQLYFEDPDALSRMVDVGEPINFTFTIVSYEKNPTTYRYNVSFNDQVFRSGTFSLGSRASPQNGQQSSAKRNQSISISLTPNRSSLVKVGDSILSSSKMTYNGALGKTTIQGFSFEPANITLPNTAIYLGPNLAGNLAFDQNKKESFIKESSTLKQKGDFRNISINGSDFLSNIGYTISHEKWNVTNDRGNLEVEQKVIDTDYLYKFQKVAVEVTSLESEIRGASEPSRPDFEDKSAPYKYEIYYWIIVKEDPEKLQAL